MKKSFICIIPTLFLAQTLWAAAVCSTDEGQVTLNDSHGIQVSGLDSKGIKSGSYSCQVVATGPGYLSVQSQILCQKKNDPETQLSGWLIEGVNFFGQRSASVALYHESLKVFEAGCAKK
jgi:hypothetical protein